MKKTLALIIALAMVLGTMSGIAFAEESTGNVAKVGETEYATIDDAIANWTNGTTLTLLADVTLSTTIKLKSTEMHTLDLGTYTLSAPSKTAIEITPEGRTSASYALDIKADATNPGGITASKCIQIKGKTGLKDRPIVRIYGGIFNGSINHSGSNGSNSPSLYIYDGVFNGSINTNRLTLIIYGGTFNAKNWISPDSTAYTLISGGKFIDVDNNMGSALNADKWTYGTAKGRFDVDIYVDDEGYYVVEKEGTGNVPAAEAVAPVPLDMVQGQYKSTLVCSKAATDGLPYTDANVALAKNTKGNITLYGAASADVKTSGNLTIDATESIAPTEPYTGNVTLGASNHTFTIILPEGGDYTGTVKQYGTSNYLLKTVSFDDDGNKVITYTQTTDPVAAGYNSVLTHEGVAMSYMFDEALVDAVAGDTIKLLKDVEINIAPQSRVAMFAMRDESIIIDLNGKKISPIDPQIPTFENNKKYIIMNGTIEGDLVNTAGSSLGIENVKIEGDIVNEGGSVVIETATVTGDISVTSGEVEIKYATVEGKIVSDNNAADVEVESGKYYSDPTAFVADGCEVIRHAEYYEVVNLALEAKAISVEFQKTDIEGNEDNLEGKDTYAIVLKANAGDKINELASADLTFAFVGTPVNGGAMSYSITPKTGITMSTDSTNADRYMFNYDGATLVEENGEAIVIATLTVEGYGAYTFSTVYATTNIVNATTVYDNLVDYYIADGDTDDSAATGALIINTDTVNTDNYIGVVDTSIDVPKRTLTINITFPNEVKKQAAVYQDMKVEITGNIEGVNQTETYDLGENMTADGKYVVTEDRLVLNNAYTVTVSGAGYRTARYTVTMTDNKELNFWNNVMDEKKAVEPGKASSEVTKNFLAGDIVKDNQINIYDLSAVVSYFATTTDITAKSDYAKYDLNRDGVIDSKDVAYVLVSWGE